MLDIIQYSFGISKVRQKLMNFYKPGVSIIMSTNKNKYLNDIYNNFVRSDYKTKELIIIINNNKISKEDYENKFKDFNNVSIYQLDENITLGECLNFGINRAKYDYIAKMDDDDYYGANYLLDLMNVFEYTDADVVGKNAIFIYFEEFNILALDSNFIENKYTKSLAGATLLIKKSVFKEIKFKNINVGEDTFFCMIAMLKVLKYLLVINIIMFVRGIKI